jgi:hypothetical protein
MSINDKPGDPADRATDAKADGAFQGSHRAGYGDRLARVEDWLRRHPSATLQSGEGAVLLAELDRVRDALGRARSRAEALALALDAINKQLSAIIAPAPYAPVQWVDASDWGREDA